MFGEHTGIARVPWSTRDSSDLPTVPLTPAQSLASSCQSGDGVPDACEPLRGDFDGDGVVDGIDLGHFHSLWGTDGSEGGDFNGDGIVDGGDLAILLGNWAY